MDETPQLALRVALLSRDDERGEFQTFLEAEGIEIVLSGRLELPLPDDWKGAEVLLVDLSGNRGHRQIEAVLQQSPVPVLLNAGGVGSSHIWRHRLLGKLQSLSNRVVPETPVGEPPPRPDLQLIYGQQQGVGSEIPWLVVLGASIGGPGAITRFLRALPASLPVTFLLAQHISEAFQEMLAEQLDRCSHWPVALLGDSQVIEAGKVWLVPAECSIEIDSGRVVRRSNRGWQSSQRPDIDAVLCSVAPRFGQHCGAILLSGLGADGTRGCDAIAQHNGFIWAQSAESCVISNLPEAVRRCCPVELSGTPEELAQALVTRCQTGRVSIN